MKKTEDAFCSNCDWAGDAAGVSACPVCGAELAKLDSFDEEDYSGKKPEKYPVELLQDEQDDFAD